jgi:hypothetical protein
MDDTKMYKYRRKYVETEILHWIRTGQNPNFKKDSGTHSIMSGPSFDKYVYYDNPQVEPMVSGEEDNIAALQTLIKSMQRMNFVKHRHCFRGTHVKTQAVAK